MDTPRGRQMLASDSSSRSTAKGRVPVMIPSCRLHQISLFVSSLETKTYTFESRGIQRIDTKTAGSSVKRGKKISHRSNKGLSSRNASNNEKSVSFLFLLRFHVIIVVMIVTRLIYISLFDDFKICLFIICMQRLHM